MRVLKILVLILFLFPGQGYAGTDFTLVLKNMTRQYTLRLLNDATTYLKPAEWQASAPLLSRYAETLKALQEDKAIDAIPLRAFTKDSLPQVYHETLVSLAGLVAFDAPPADSKKAVASELIAKAEELHALDVRLAELSNQEAPPAMDTFLWGKEIHVPRIFVLFLFFAAICAFYTLPFMAILK